jgi:hypothetical protein
MRNILALVGFVVVGFAGLGWYLGWYTFSFKPDTDGKVNIQGSIDAKKIGEDAMKAKATVGKAIENFNQTPPTGQQTNEMGPPLPPDMRPLTSPPTANRPSPAGTNLPNGR